MLKQISHIAILIMFALLVCDIIVHATMIERMCQDRIDWAIQDTLDATLQACEEKIESMK